MYQLQMSHNHSSSVHEILKSTFHLSRTSFMWEFLNPSQTWIGGGECLKKLSIKLSLIQFNFRVPYVYHIFFSINHSSLLHLYFNVWNPVLPPREMFNPLDGEHGIWFCWQSGLQWMRCHILCTRHVQVLNFQASVKEKFTIQILFFHSPIQRIFW